MKKLLIAVAALAFCILAGCAVTEEDLERIRGTDFCYQLQVSESLRRVCIRHSREVIEAKYRNCVANAGRQHGATSGRFSVPEPGRCDRVRKRALAKLQPSR